MNPSVSVIIPVYNAERYLRQCLDSVCAQTLREIEIICVNDGSTDGSAAILAEYAERDERIRVITQPNAGAGAARNTGLDAANGEYLAFIDSDDFWKPELLEKAYARVKQFDADLCLYPFAVYDENTGKITGTEYEGWLPEEKVFSPVRYGDRLFQMTAPAPGYRLYRRKMITDNLLDFLPQHIAEDIYFVFLSMVFAAKICYIRDVCAYLRRGMTDNLSSALWRYPRETHHSLLEIRRRLEKAGLYTIYRETFRIAAISACEYLFWHVPEDVLPKEERLQMLRELDIADKPSIITYHGQDEVQSSGKLGTLRRMLAIYGLRYTIRYIRQSLRKS